MTTEFSQSHHGMAAELARLSREYGGMEVRVGHIEQRQTEMDKDIQAQLREVLIRQREMNDYFMEGRGMKKMLILMISVASGVTAIVTTAATLMLT